MLIFPLVIILGLFIGLVSPKAPILVVAFMIVPFLLININFKSYLFFALIVSQIYVGVIAYFIPIHINFGVIDNAYKALGFTGFSLLMIYTGLKAKKEILKTNYLVCFFISVVYFLYSAITAENSTDMLYILKFLVPPLLFVTITMNYEQINWSKAYKWIKVFVLVNLLFCFYQIFTGSGVMSDIVRASGLTPSRNTFSMYLVFLFDFILIASFLLKKNKFSLISLISILVMEFISFGRAGWAILGLTLILTLLFYKKIKALLVSLTFVSLAAYIFWDKILLRMQSGEGTTEHRDHVTSLLMQFGYERPFTGYGFGWAQEFLIRNPDVSQGLTQPHNDFVRLFVDTGVIGLALFILPFILMIFRSIKLLFNKNKEVKQIAFITLLSVIQLFAFMKVYNTVDMYFASTMMVWLFMAILEMKQED